MKRICLVLDNPLRDLDGICLLAWQFTEMGHEVFIVPMYTQGFDIPSLRPDIVILNYARANNFDLLKLYQNLNIAVAVLDTEGVGEWWREHAGNLRRSNVDEFVDLYLCWGKRQSQILKDEGSLKADKIVATGCPRYDFVSYPWRKIFQTSGFEGGYILINTNFPVVNPQFAEGTKAEVAGWVKSGWGSQEKANAMAEASGRLFEDILIAVESLVVGFPEQCFVLRPHPFEDISAYSDIANRYDNLVILKEGTSLQWIHSAKALLHVNCFTGVEAGMMGVEALSFEWLNHEIIREHSSEPYKVSRKASSIDELKGWISCLVNGEGELSPDRDKDKALQELIENNYFSIDGHSAKRVAVACQKVLEDRMVVSNRQTLQISQRQQWVRRLRMILGYSNFSKLQRMFLDQHVISGRQKKYPSLDTISQRLKLLDAAAGTGKTTIARLASSSDERSGKGSRLVVRVAR